MTTTEIRYVIERDDKFLYVDSFAKKKRNRFIDDDITAASWWTSENKAAMRSRQIRDSHVRRVQIETTYTLLED